MTALSPLSYRRIRDVLSNYGEGAHLYLAHRPQSDAPWQPDTQNEPEIIQIKMLITTQRLADVDSTPDDAALTQALGLLPIDAGLPHRGDRLESAGAKWVIRQILPLKPGRTKATSFQPKTAQIIQMVLNNSGGMQ